MMYFSVVVTECISICLIGKIVLGGTSKSHYQDVGANGECITRHRKLPGTFDEGVNHCVKIGGNGAVVSKELYMPRGDITFMLDFKFDSQSETCMDLFTYESLTSLSFGLQICTNFSNDVEDREGNLFLTVDETDSKSKNTYSYIYLKLLTWYRIVIVWNQNASVLQASIFNMNDEDTIEQQEVYLNTKNGSKLEENYGFISLGRNLKQGKSHNVHDNTGIQLWVDEMMMWNKVFSLLDLLKQYRYLENGDKMKHAFHFSEGKGVVTADSKSKNYLYLIGYGIARPSWAMCEKNTIKGSVIPTPYERNRTFHDEAKSMCKDIIFHDAMLSHCGMQLAPSVSQFFFMNCLNDCTRSKNLYAAVHSLEQYANYCQRSMCSSFWPLYPVCDTMSRSMAPQRCHQDVERPCYAGHLTEKSKCICDRGWFGDACSNICPGGIDRSCGGVGKCDQDSGRCICPINFDSLSNCTRCIESYKGNNCNLYVLQTYPKLELMTSSGYGYGRYVTFGGLVYDLPLTGEFMFLQSKDLSIYVRQIPRSDSENEMRCQIAQIWINFNGIDITMMSSLTHNAPILFIEKKISQIEIGKSQGVHLSENALLWKISDSWIELEMNISSKSRSKEELVCTHVRVNAMDNLLNLFVTCNRQEEIVREPKSPAELQGKCILSYTAYGSTVETLKSSHSKSENKPELHRDVILEKYVDDCSLSKNVNSGFIYKMKNGYQEPRFPTAAGNSLRFVTELKENIAAVNNFDIYEMVESDRLENIFESVTSDGITFEMFVKKETDGVFFSFVTGSSQQNGFDLSFDNNNVMKIKTSTQIWTSTDIVLQDNDSFSEWGMLSINCRRDGKYLWLYYTAAGGVIYESKIFAEIDCFDPSGTIKFGGEIQELSSAIIKRHFTGTIDEIRIWDKILSKFQTLQNFGRKFNPKKVVNRENSYDPKLVAVWNFDEGQGDVAKNLIPGGPDMTVRKVSFNSKFLSQRRVFWTPSDAPVITQYQQSTSKCDCNSTVESLYAVFADEPSTKYAEKLCRNSLKSILENKICLEGLGEKQDVFIMQCIEDVVRSNSTEDVAISKKAYSSLCRFTLNLKDPCMTNPCQHSGTCETIEGTEYRCICECGYTGRNCEIDIDECKNDSCINGGKCFDGICNFRCACPEGYVGNICQRKCTNPLGLESHAIDDSQITASSEYQTGMPWYISYLASRGRLNHSGWGSGWVPRDNDREPWLQISFPESMRITGITLQGANWNGYNSWVTKFSISTSKDGNAWIKHGGNYKGNNDSHTAVHILFQRPIKGCYIRIYPKIYHIRPAIRMELYGCSACDCCNELGMESFFIQNSQITASSIHGLKCERCSSSTAALPRFGRLDGPKNRFSDLNLWMAEKNDIEPWIMVDLLSDQYVNGIIVQGGNYYRYPIYTKLFKVEYSTDNLAWNSIPEEFGANEDAISHKRIVFDDMFRARYVKIILKDWNNHPGIRFELLGCSIDEMY